MIHRRRGRGEVRCLCTGFVLSSCELNWSESRGHSFERGAPQFFLVALLLLSGILRGRRMTTSLRTEGAAGFDPMPWGTAMGALRSTLVCRILSTEYLIPTL